MRQAGGGKGGGGGEGIGGVGGGEGGGGAGGGEGGGGEGGGGEGVAVRVGAAAGSELASLGCDLCEETCKTDGGWDKGRARKWRLNAGGEGEVGAGIKRYVNWRRLE